MFIRSPWESRILRAPENDEGFDYEEADDQEIEDVEDDGLDEPEVEDVEDVEVENDGRQESREEVERPKSRGENRVAEATRVAAEAKRRAEEAERRLAAIEQAQQQNLTRESAAQREQRLAMMDPDQRTQYLLQEQAQHFEARLNAIQFTAQDSADRTAFEALCARNPIAAKHSEKVEAELAKLRATGQTAPRATVLRYVIGDSALLATPRARTKAAQTAAGNRARQSARPASGRSDVSASDRRNTSLYDRIKDIEI